MKNILITGGLGFIGSHVVRLFCEKYKEYTVINLDKMTYAANEELVEDFKKFSNYKLVKGDVSDKELVQSIFSENKIDGVINLAAESHVDNSISGPEAFFTTNVMGTLNLVSIAKEMWSASGDLYKNRFHHVSTDEVFGSLGAEGYFTEETAYAPNNPYSASKASSDFVLRSFNKTFGLNSVITNCSNNFGQWQNDEKLIPTIIRKAIKGEAIPIYGNGSNIRDWLYVATHAEAIDVVFHKGKAGETYNIGADNECTNLSLCHMICEVLNEVSPRAEGDYKDLIKFVTDRPGHDQRYAIDSSKLKKELGFSDQKDFKYCLRETIEWYLKKWSV